MRQYLSHRRRLCDKANQAHPPAAPAALERKHPVDAHQQLCPQISRWESAPRSAAVCTHCLWPRWLTPRSQLPPSLRRHQFPPRRVRRQHPKVVVPMLARWRYQKAQPDPETRLRSVAVQSVFAALPCALATPTASAGSTPAYLLPPTPAAPQQTSDAHNIATAARAQRYPALPPARPHALKIRPCAPTPALPLPSTFSAKTCSTRPNRSLGVSAGFCRLCPPQSPASGAGFVGYLPFHLLLLSSSIEQGELRK